MTSKQEVPFSTAAEALGLLIAFELLQESGIHLPQAIGQSVSTIGGIVVGTAAVDAGLISPVVLIVVIRFRPTGILGWYMSSKLKVFIDTKILRKPPVEVFEEVEMMDRVKEA